MKIAFIKYNFNNTTRLLLDKIEGIVEEYREKGYVLTLRQLYYQLVSRDIISNKLASYNKISRILNDARLSGVIDWDMIEDRLRRPKLPYLYEGVGEAIGDTAATYRIDRMRGQKVYIECWVEKDAISSILYRQTAEYGIRLVVNRGYASVSALYDAYNRFKREEGKEIYILYLGDHDPSGLDMIRDVGNRMGIFGADDIKVIHVALTSEQVRKFNPPPNPAKFSDPRSDWYIKKFGTTSWEVDALSPETFDTVVINNIEMLIDKKQYSKMLAQEKKERSELFDIARNY